MGNRRLVKILTTNQGQTRKVRAEVLGSFGIYSRNGTPAIVHLATGRHLPGLGDPHDTVRRLNGDGELIRDLDAVPFGAIVPRPILERLVIHLQS